MLITFRTGFPAAPLSEAKVAADVIIMSGQIQMKNWPVGTVIRTSQ